MAGFLALTTLDRSFFILALSAAILLAISFSFAILALGLRVRNDAKTRRWDRMTKKWEPAMLEVLGGAAPPEAMYDRVDDAEGPFFLTFLLRYARLLRGEEQALVRKMARPYLPAMVPLVKKGTEESRGNAVQLLARMGMPEYAEAVAGALRDESPIVAMIAARSLFRPGQENHFGQVLEHLSRFGRWSRSFLAGMLSAGGPRAAPLLRDMLANRKEKSLIRAVAADALRDLNDLDSVHVAMRLLPAETDRETIAGCLRLLKQLGHRDHVPIVRSLVGSLDPVIRATAVSALGSIGGREEIRLLQDKLDDPSFWVSLEAARGLLALGDRATLERLAASGGPWATLARQVLSE